MVATKIVNTKCHWAPSRNWIRVRSTKGFKEGRHDQGQRTAEIRSPHNMLGRFILSFSVPYDCQLRYVWRSSSDPFTHISSKAFAGKSQIGSGPGTVINNEEWNEIVHTCFRSVAVISMTEESAINALGLLTWLFISIMLIYHVILPALEEKHERQWNWLRSHSLTFDTLTTGGARLWILLCAMVLILAVSQMSTFFRLQRLQRDMTKATGGKFADEE